MSIPFVQKHPDARTNNSSVRCSPLTLGLAILVGLALSACDGATSDDPVATQTQALQASQPSSRPIDNQLIVQTTPGADPASVGQSAAATHNGEVLHTYTHALQGFALRVPDQAADTVRQALENNPKVTLVETDRTARAVGQTLPSGVDRMEADKNATADIDGKDERIGIDVAILDTGIDKDHADLNVA
ncbi:MAG: protease inhibitor I9 family protein, partial [Bradymonadaceae bacterium]